MKELVPISTDAPTALMQPEAAAAFELLRSHVRKHAGVDFLAKCGDVFRPRNFRSGKDGVADRSWHKTGRAFDYDQSHKALIIVSEVIAGKQYFRTWLKCGLQNGSQGEKKHLRDYRNILVSGWYFDFTAAAREFGFERIPAWKGWQKSYNRREFWHYQKADGLTWAAAMNEIYGSGRPSSAVATKRTIGLNDRDKNTGGRVTKIQRRLKELEHLPAAEIDGIFGPKTKAAVQSFQRWAGLDVDGIVGPNTLKALKI